MGLMDRDYWKERKGLSATSTEYIGTKETSKKKQDAPKSDGNLPDLFSAAFIIKIIIFITMLAFSFLGFIALLTKSVNDSEIKSDLSKNQNKSKSNSNLSTEHETGKTTIKVSKEDLQTTEKNDASISQIISEANEIENKKNREAYQAQQSKIYATVEADYIFLYKNGADSFRLCIEATKVSEYYLLVKDQERYKLWASKIKKHC